MSFAGCGLSRNTATLPSVRPDYSPEQLAAWMKRHEEFVEIARGGNVDVLFLGDSLTDGWRTHGREIWERAFLPLRAANFGLAGDRTQQILWRIAHGELDGIHPRAVVLLIGTNNTTPGLGSPSLTPRNTPQEIIAGITAVMEAVQQKLPEAKIILFGIFPRGEKDDPLRAEIAFINQTLSGLAQSHAIHFLDIGADFLSSDGSISPEIMPDLLHLRAAGYQRWANRLAPLLSLNAPVIPPQFANCSE
jgi:lysophospholipase L1-like esterase